MHADLALFTVDRDGLNAQYVADPQITEQPTFEQNTFGRMTFTLPPSSSDAARIGKYQEVALVYRGTVVWWGVVISREVTRPSEQVPRVTFRCADLLWYFHKRFVGKASRTNYALDPNFEADVGDPLYGAWAVVGAGVTFSRDGDRYKLHGRSAKVESATAGEDWFIYEDILSFTATGVGDLLTVSGWFFIEDDGSFVGPAIGKRGIALVAYDGGDPSQEPPAVVDIDGAIGGNTPRGSWQFGRATMWLPPDAVRDLQLRCYAIGGTIRYGAIQVVRMESLSSVSSATDFTMDMAKLMELLVQHAQDTGLGKDDVNITTSCFAGETRVITDRGARPIAELAGSTHRLLTSGARWVDAPVKSFGVQPLRRITLTRAGVKKVVYATPEHRWFVRHVLDEQGPSGTQDERTTDELRPGHRLAYVFAKKSSRIKPSRFGIAHGFVFGDGGRGPNDSRAYLFGQKDIALRPIFEGEQERFGNKDGIEFGGLPKFFKSLPPRDESRNYLYGWLAGYFAADGTVSKDGRTITLNSASRAHLEFARDVCTTLGIGTYAITEKRRRGYGTEDSSLYGLNFIRGMVAPDFFLIPEHRSRYEKAGPQQRDLKGWRVESVELTDRVEEVFCAVVDGVGAFALEDNILTGNCPDVSVRIERHYQYVDHANILRALQEFPAEGGPDFWIDWEVPDPGDPWVRTFRTALPRGTARDLSYKVGPGFVWTRSFRHLDDGDAGISSITLLGFGDGPDREEYGIIDTGGTGGLIVEEIVAAPVSTDIDALAGVAETEFSARSMPDVWGTVVHRPDWIGVLAPGDTIHLDYTDPADDTYQDVVRIAQITLDTDTLDLDLTLNRP